MYTRAELEYKQKIRNAQLSLRVVVFSIALIVPVWIGAYVAQRLGFAQALDTAVRPIGIALLGIYAVGVGRIIIGAARQHAVNCPKCGRDLSWELAQAIRTNACPRCGEKIVR